MIGFKEYCHQLDESLDDFLKDSTVKNVVYHGTSHDITEFKRKSGDIGIHVGTIGQANDRIKHKMLDSPYGREVLRQGGPKAHAELITGEHIMPVHIQLKNPIRLEDEGQWNVETMQDHLWTHPDFDVNKQNTLPKIRKWLQDKGHDGIVYRNQYEREGNAEMRMTQLTHLDNLFKIKDQWHRDDPEMKQNSAMEAAWRKHSHEGTEDSYIVFEPHQIKSAIGNKGTFDPKSKNISESREEALKAWHADSHPITKNPDGSPKTFYHGTFHDFDEFTHSNDLGYHFASAEIANNRLGKAASERKLRGHARTAGTNVMPVHLNIKNPLHLPEDPGSWRFAGLHYDLEKAGVMPTGSHAKALDEYPKVFAGMQASHPPETSHTELHKKANAVMLGRLKTHLEGMGYDGLSYINHYEGEGKGRREKRKNPENLTLVAFHPHQIKSAIGNKGTFDTKSKKITESAEKVRLRAKDMPFRVEDHEEKDEHVPTHATRIRDEMLKEHPDGPKSAYEINCGYCDQFANRLVNHVGGSVWTSGVDQHDDFNNLPTHYFVEHKGKFYDAEAPHGVNSWYELPVFKNHAHLWDNLEGAMKSAHKLGPAWRPKKNSIKEETMTRKLTLTVVETEKKIKELLESTKDLPLFEATQKFEDAGFDISKFLDYSDSQLAESMLDDRVNSIHAMDRFYIATHGNDAHRDQLIKDEDAMVRFGVAKVGHLTHLAQLASDPSPMVRDQVARRADEELAKKLENDPHPMVRASAYNRMQEIRRTIDDPAIISSENGVSESVEEPKHFESGDDIQVKSDGRFAKIKTLFEAKEGGFWYVVGLPTGGSEVLHESEVRGLDEENLDDGYSPKALQMNAAGLLAAREQFKKTNLEALKVIDGHLDVAHKAILDRDLDTAREYIGKAKEHAQKHLLTEDRENEHDAKKKLNESIDGKVFFSAPILGGGSRVRNAHVRRMSTDEVSNHFGKALAKEGKGSMKMMSGENDPNEMQGHEITIDGKEKYYHMNSVHGGPHAFSVVTDADGREYDPNYDWQHLHAMKAVQSAYKNDGINESVEWVTEDHENEFSANLSLAGHDVPSKPNKPVKLKRADGSIHSEHENESSAIQAYKDEPNNKGMKIVREERVEVDVPLLEMGGGGGGYDAEAEFYKSQEFKRLHSAIRAETDPTKLDVMHQRVLKSHLQAATVGTAGERNVHATLARAIAQNPHTSTETLNKMREFADWRVKADVAKRLGNSADHAFFTDQASKESHIYTESVAVDLVEKTVEGLGLNLDPNSQLDGYDREKAFANECPFCAGEEPVSADEHEAAMNYHTEQAKRADLPLQERHFHSRAFMKHQRVKG